MGPYARLRQDTNLGQNVKIGNFVETKNSTFADYSKANHLSYLGDTEIGQKVNIGAGTITCNFDGVNKFTTTIHDGAFIGSNSSLVAPITIGKGALIGAGSVITKDVDENAVSLTRSPQTQIKDGADAHRMLKETVRGMKRPVSIVEHLIDLWASLFWSLVMLCLMNM